jgi:hypothetical protein
MHQPAGPASWWSIRQAFRVPHWPNSNRLSSHVFPLSSNPAIFTGMGVQDEFPHSNIPTATFHSMCRVRFDLRSNSLQPTEQFLQYFIFPKKIFLLFSGTNREETLSNVLLYPKFSSSSMA